MLVAFKITSVIVAAAYAATVSDVMNEALVFIFMSLFLFLLLMVFIVWLLLLFSVSRLFTSTCFCLSLMIPVLCLDLLLSCY